MGRGGGARVDLIPTVQSKGTEQPTALDYYNWNNSYWFDMGMAIHFVCQCGAVRYCVLLAFSGRLLATLVVAS